jgi:hypothetical protein
MRDAISPSCRARATSPWRADGQPVATQATADGLWIDAGELAPYSVSALTAAADALPARRRV